MPMVSRMHHLALFLCRLTFNICVIGFYDTQYQNREKPDCRGRLHTDKDGKYGYRAVVPVAYPIPGDVSLKSIL